MGEDQCTSCAFFRFDFSNQRSVLANRGQTTVFVILGPNLTCLIVSYFMPNSLRLLFYIGVIIGVTYGGLFAIATFLEPAPREMSTSIGKIKLP